MGRIFVSKFLDYEDKNVQEILKKVSVDFSSGNDITAAIIKFVFALHKVNNIDQLVRMNDEEKKAIGSDFLAYLQEKGKGWDYGIDTGEGFEGINLENNIDYVNEFYNDEDEMYLDMVEPQLQEENVDNQADLITEPRPADQDKVMKEFFIPDITGAFNDFSANIHIIENDNLNADKRFLELIDVDNEDTRDAFRQRENYNTLYGTIIIPTSSNTYYRKVLDRNAYSRLHKKTESLINDSEALVDSQVQSGKMGVNEAMYIKAFSISKMKRALRGFPNTYISSRTPLGAGIDSINSEVIGDTTDNALEGKINRWRDKYPVHDLAIEGENQLCTLADYWADKEQNKMTPEKEQLYRKTLYSQTLRMLNMINAMDKTVIDPELNTELVQQGITNSNPICLHSYAPRGMTTLSSALDAYKAGLENGWHIDDIGVLAAFNRCLEGEKKSVNYVIDNNTEKLEKRKVPAYKSEDHKAFLDNMEKFYDKLKNNRLTGKGMRNTVMKQMYAMVKEGKDRGFISNEYASNYFGDVFASVSKRNALIEQSKEPAFYKEDIVASKERGDELNLLLLRFNADKSFFIKFGISSDEHDALSNSVQKLINNQKTVALYNEGRRGLQTLGNYLDYFNALDEAIVDSKIYQSKKKGVPTTEGGKDRLKGAKDIELLAKNERNNLINNINHNKELVGLEDNLTNSLENFRIAMAKETCNRGRNVLAKAKAMPTDKAGKQKFYDAAADILVYKFASSNNKKVLNSFHNMGINKLKGQIKESSEFKSLMNEYFRDTEMTPDKLFEKLYGEDGITRMNSNRQKLERNAEKNREKQAEVENKMQSQRQILP